MAAQLRSVLMGDVVMCFVAGVWHGWLAILFRMFFAPVFFSFSVVHNVSLWVAGLFEEGGFKAFKQVAWCVVWLCWR